GIGREVVAVALGADDADKQPALGYFAGIIENVLDFGIQIPLYEGVGKPFEKLFQTHRNHLLTKYSSYQTKKMNTHHSWRQLSRLPERCWSSILLSAAVLKN